MTSVTMPEPMFAIGTFSAEQMQAYADARVREALEEVEEVVVTLYESDDLPYLPDITRAIRALIPKENKS